MEEFIHKAGDGKLIPIKDMKNKHLQNTINLIEDKSERGKDVLKELNYTHYKNEAIRRNELLSIECVKVIESLYPPTCQYESTEDIGRELMDVTVGNSVGYKNWKNLPPKSLYELALANIDVAREKYAFKNRLITYKY